MQAAIVGLLAVVVALQVEEMGNGVHSCAGEQAVTHCHPTGLSRDGVSSRVLPVSRASA